MQRRPAKKMTAQKQTNVSHDEIAREAFKLYQSRHGVPGDPVADWFEATRIVTSRTMAKAPRTMAAEANATGGSRARARARRRARK